MSNKVLALLSSRSHLGKLSKCSTVTVHEQHDPGVEVGCAWNTKTGTLQSNNTTTHQKSPSDPTLWALLTRASPTNRWQRRKFNLRPDCLSVLVFVLLHDLLLEIGHTFHHLHQNLDRLIRRSNRSRSSSIW